MARFMLYPNECREGQILVDTTDGRELGCDFGEPEDNSFGRDWAWVPDELNALADEIERLKAQLHEIAV